ncbi:hypothetical protein [Streptomyces sp. TRM49041]|uniref:hypothetical protein n=1 Tax=Streptomyces sp. TRM49041 TaxID=2603216 RepID=UPI0011EFE615|nr:hypothetical protein [Streptomyces sp. TRM49041]
MNLRMIGLGAVVAAATLLPMVAIAGPAGGPEHTVVAADGERDPAAAAPTPDASPVGSSVSDDKAPGADPGSLDSPLSPLLAESDSTSYADSESRVTQCGPALVSPDGVEAQTCVVAEAAESWARTYYRNIKGEELRAILSFMGPAGRTVRTHCVVAAGDEPRTCETPRESVRGGIEDYTAVAEFAASGDPESPLLLRSGSNRPQTAAG